MSLSVVTKENCQFCGSSGVEWLIPAGVLPDKVGVLRCPDCDLAFLEPRAGHDDIDREERAYWDNEKQKALYSREEVKNVFLREFDKRLDILELFKPNGGKLLDVGCGIGHFLFTAKRRHWDVKGLDVSPAASRAAKEAYGIDVAIGTLENANFERAQFDVITLWDVIEHIRRPLENVQAANRLLRHSGIIAMKTPNEHGLFKWAARQSFRWFGQRGAFLLKYVYYVPHYFSYSRKSLDILLRQNGFEPVRYELDETPEEFGRGKIDVHYRKDPKRALVLTFLSFTMFLARIFRRKNKIIVYAKKMKDV